jgi:hypothetical protein
MRSWKPFWFARIGVFALAISIFAACGDDTTGPTGGDLDPAVAAAGLDQINAKYFEGNAGVQGLEYFGDFMIGALGADVAAFDLLPFATANRLENIPTALRLSVAEGVSPERIPVGALGKVFVYNPDTFDYEIDPLRQAPADAVWFILYAVDPVLGQPVEVDGELVEVGYLEIKDTSDFPTVNIAMKAVVSDIDAIDVNVTGTLSDTQFNLDLVGTLSDGVDELDFSLRLDAEASGSSATFSTEFNFSAGGFEVDLNLTGADEADGSIEFSITDGTNIIRFNLEVVAGVIQDGSGVWFGLDQVADISGTIENPIVTNGEGDPLTQQEIAALGELFEAMDDFFEFFLGTVTFALFLLLLGLI